MKCKICGYRCSYIEDMAAHYRKKHPRRMKRTRKVRGQARKLIKKTPGVFTPREVEILKRIARGFTG